MFYARKDNYSVSLFSAFFYLISYSHRQLGGIYYP